MNNQNLYKLSVINKFMVERMISVDEFQGELMFLGFRSKKHNAPRTFAFSPERVLLTKYDPTTNDFSGHYEPRTKSIGKAPYYRCVLSTNSKLMLVSMHDHFQDDYQKVAKWAYNRVVAHCEPNSHPLKTKEEIIRMLSE